jgi:hypothetical protein
MRTRNVTLVGIAVALVGLAIGLALWLSLRSTSAPKALTQASYAHLLSDTTIGKTTIETVESTWPKPPYQDFHDGNGNHCLEWIDQVKTLYDLCFDKTGLLVSSQTP